MATLFGDNGMLTKADEARIANEKARIKDLVSTEVLASYDTTGKLNKEQLLANLNNIPAEVTDLTNNKNFAWDLTFKVDGYNVTIKENGTAIVGDETGEGGTENKPNYPIKVSIFSQSDISHNVGSECDLSDACEGVVRL